MTLLQLNYKPDTLVRLLKINENKNHLINIDPRIKGYIEKLLGPELYFQNMPSCQNMHLSLPQQPPSQPSIRTENDGIGGHGGGAKNKPLIKTKEKITIAGRMRTLYIGAHKKQYVKMKGIYVSVAVLKKAEKLKKVKKTHN